MKPKIYLLALFSSFLFSGCESGYKYSYREKSMYRKPVATVEKAWLARHKYDHERRLIIPMVGGTRWGATQEYRENGTLVYKDWWERDVKLEDLEPAPTTRLSISKIKPVQKVGVLGEVILDDVPTSTTNEPIDFVPEENDTPDNKPPIPSLVEENPFAPLPVSPPLPVENQPSTTFPFEPLPDALPPLD